MQPFTQHRGLVATLNRANVDTDQIVPAQFLKSIRRTGFGPALFQQWRYLPDGSENPEFELNAPRFKGATILVARNNFGCGSSREHAVWAIMQYGFRVVIAPCQGEGNARMPAFADIFRNNAVKNGLLTVELTEAEVDSIFREVARHEGLEATVDLERQRVVLHLPRETVFRFQIDPTVKKQLVEGLDEVAATLQYEKDIVAFEKKHDVQMRSSQGSAAAW